MRNIESLPTCQNEWMLNVSLLKEINKETTTPEERQCILFLANNYLNKTAPIFHDDLRKLCHDLSYQAGGWGSWNYHRISVAAIIKLCEPFTHHLFLGKKSPLILTDTLEIDATFKLKFLVTPSLHADMFVDTLVQHLRAHLTTPLIDLPRPFLLDLTAELPNEQAFDGVKKAVKTQIEVCIQKLRAAHVIQSKDVDAVRQWIQQNLTCICRVQDNALCGIKLLPIFSTLNADNVESRCQKFIDFTRETGLLINPLYLRRHVVNAFKDHPNLEYAVKGTKSLIPQALYPQKQSFTAANFFQRACALIDSEWGSTSAMPHCAVLGKATVKVLKGLMEEISDEEWQAISNDRVKGSLFQLALFKIQEHLGRALLYRSDFTAFASKLELVHAELPTLLELFSLFNTTPFSTIYTDCLRACVPTSLQASVQSGLGKTAVNVFTGINEIILSEKPVAVRVHCENYYYEQKSLLGEKHDYHAFLQSGSIQKVDLYVGQFSPNIELDPSVTGYQRNDVAGHIKELITTQRAAEAMTVAIDCTIDRLNSDNVKTLLATFETEIQNGRLNFIFFQSGAKFNTFGMDNYYAAPFFIVNNRQDHWKAFKRLQSSSVYQTDPLSTRWYCLAYKYALEEQATYRTLIFDNTRAILNRVARFTPKRDNVRIGTVDAAMDACFIDLKVFGWFNHFKSNINFAKFYYMMRAQGITSYSRASFGFFHTNYIIISDDRPDSKTVRINPGINSEHNAAIVAYLAHVVDSPLPD
jgi:hypothetical protein